MALTAVLNPPAITTKYRNIITKSRTINSPFNFLSFSCTKLTICAAKKKHLSEVITHKQDAENKYLQDDKEASEETDDLGWMPCFPHVLTASMSNFLFGYHIGVMNGPIISIAQELGFKGNTILEGLVVSIFIGGAFLGSITSSSLVDKLGCRRTLQLATIPLILGAIMRNS